MDTPFSKYPSADALMPKDARTKAKRGVSRPGLKNDPPGAREARRRPHDQETLWPISAYSLRMLHKVGPCVCSARGDSRSDSVQDPASSNPPVNADFDLSPSYVVSACSSCVQTAAANDSELSSHAVLPIREPYLRSPRLTCQSSQHAETCMTLDPHLPRSPRHCRSGSIAPVAGETVI
jgi:hypothetical protein